MSKGTLSIVDQIKEARKRRGRTKLHVTEEEIDLVLEYFQGAVSLTEIGRVLQIHGTASVYLFLMRILREAVNRDLITMTKCKKVSE